ncbi:MAG: GGDEF domain-containing protein [Magnetococcales bacterium]|nr:GGDEF domain-containing protein [Magnetococcales bacterium]MBF0322352.1 GGDEF domain-containing protein [Magnetococcales bacterium]
MGIVLSLKNRSLESQANLLLTSYSSNLIEELDWYRRRSEHLARIYDLHKELSGKLDLASMVDAFSFWLTPHLRHDLVAYRSEARHRSHVVCSMHGPRRQELMDYALRLLEAPPPVGCGSCDGHPGLRFCLVDLNPDGPTEAILMLHRANPDTESVLVPFMGEMAVELRGPLERALAYEDLYDQARRDMLTGLVNRRVFHERLEQELSKAQRYGAPLVLAGLDLDHFKDVNDLMGHGKGDEVLRLVSATLSRMVRDTDVLARVGGDEFSLILTNTDLDKAEHLLDRLCQSVADLNIQAPGAERLGVSIGFARWERNESMETFVTRVDDAMYRAKAAGRCRVSR